MTQAIGPNLSMREWSNISAWSDFHQDILNKGKSLDRVIDVLQNIINRFNGRDEEDIYQEEMFRKPPVGNCEIRKHFVGYMGDIISEEGLLHFPEGKRISFNYANNILRCLKRIRDDEAPFQLPYLDKKLTEGFIQRLRSRPSLFPYFFNW